MIYPPFWWIVELSMVILHQIFNFIMIFPMFGIIFLSEASYSPYSLINEDSLISV